MKLLFIVYSVPNPANGISKKIQAQIEGLKHSGIDVSLCHFLEKEDTRFWAVDGCPIAEIGKGIKAHLKFYTYFKPIIQYIYSNGFDTIYLRYVHNATPWMLDFFKKLKRCNVSIYMEIPTYPYDGEYTDVSLFKRFQMSIEHTCRTKFNKYLSKIITFSCDKKIFNVPTINLSNAVALDKIPVKQVNSHRNEIHFIGVANLSFWHGFDRLINGLFEYYKTEKSRNVFFDIVGGGNLINDLKMLVSRLQLDDVVIFHGSLSGNALNEIFNQSDIGVGCLGCHRKGIQEVKSLKNVEYAARGIPFIYSEDNNDFDNKEYVIKVPPNETPINIKSVLDCYSQINNEPKQIRETICNLSWDCQMQKVAADFLNH